MSLTKMTVNNIVKAPMQIKKWLKAIAILVPSLLTLSIIVFVLWLFKLDHEIRQRLSERRFLPPTEFYSAPEKIWNGQIVKVKNYLAQLKSRGYRFREFGQTLRPGDYSIWEVPECQELIYEWVLPDNAQICVAFRSDHDDFPDLQLLAIDSENRVISTFKGERLMQNEYAVLPPIKFAQFYGVNPILRREVRLGDIPTDCLNGTVAIEDKVFLEHQGISIKGIARAFYQNLRQGRMRQGGSTITQQLIKNYFLSPERTLRRKIKEAAMAVLLEMRASKDDILETYLNLIYMGQNGPFSVRGFGAASEHYFAKKVERLDLAECSLLAAIINSPGLYNPFRHPKRSRFRREKVLRHMLEQGFISPDEMAKAANKKLPKPPKRLLSEPAPYYVQAVRRRLRDLGMENLEGLRIFTGLNLQAQEAAQKSVRDGLTHLNKRYAKIKDYKESGKELEAALISADLATGDIQALIGGKRFKSSQYNRAIEAHRQVGSIMKPFVFLHALESHHEDGTPYTPLTLVEDELFTHQYEGQEWTPKNFDKVYRGLIPIFYALKNSINVVTARVGIDTGLNGIIDVARRTGVHSRINPVPALTLGAFELYPKEVLQAYTTIARFGAFRRLRLIRRVETLEGKVEFAAEESDEQRIALETAAVLVGMMRQTLENGTGASARGWGFKHVAAGKTGTTSDSKDAWFSGFTPFHVAVAWVGYDDNTPHDLTGASGALPIWSLYMRRYASRFPNLDFDWPPGTVAVTLDTERLRALNVPEDDDHPLKPIELIFRKGTE